MNLITLYCCCYIHTHALLGFGEKFFVQNKSTSQGLPYDFSSIMHFRHNAFSGARNESTVVPRNHTIPKTILGGSANVTDLDFLHLNLLYCRGTDAITSYKVVHLIVSSCNFLQISRTYMLYCECCESCLIKAMNVI